MAKVQSKAVLSKSDLAAMAHIGPSGEQSAMLIAMQL